MSFLDGVAINEEENKNKAIESNTNVPINLDTEKIFVTTKDFTVDIKLSDDVFEKTNEPLNKIEENQVVSESSTFSKTYWAYNTNNLFDVDSNQHETSDSSLSEISDDDTGSHMTYDLQNPEFRSIDGEADAKNILREYVWEKDTAFNQRINGTIIPNEPIYVQHFRDTCQKLCHINGDPNTTRDTPNKMDIQLTSSNIHQTITSTEIFPLLDSCFVYMYGGKDRNQAQILCFPHYPNLQDVDEKGFQEVILYLTSLARPSVDYAGFVLLVDRRKEKWTSLRKLLIRLISYFPGDLKMILVLRPVRFLQRKVSDMGFWLQRDQFVAKVPIIMLSGVSELRKYIDVEQLPVEYGGTFAYDHKTWLRNRMLIENFVSHTVDIARSLDAYGLELETTELPQGVTTTQYILQTQKESSNYYKEKVAGLLETAFTLKNTINISSSGKTADVVSCCLETDILQKITTMIEDIDATFRNCWMKHEEKLKQCLELRQFEQDFSEAMSKLYIYQQWCDQQSDHVGTNSSWVEYLINEAERMKENFSESSVEYSLLTTIGGGMIQTNCYVSSYMQAKCVELEQNLSKLNKAFELRTNFLVQIHSILLKIEELNCWCDKAMSLLAGQGIEKAQSCEGARNALIELENFFSNDPRRGPIITEAIPESVENYKIAVNSRYEEAMFLFEKRRSYFNKTVTRYNERPVQRVEPSVQTQPQTVKPSETASSNQATSNSDDPSVQLRYVMNELLSTEQIYVNELNGIIEGYGKAIDDEANCNLVPKELKGNADVLLGNMEEIYQFHSKVFLNELEECKNTPALVGKCFIKRKEKFDIYSKYCQNSAKSEELRLRVGEQNPFFIECQRKLGHVLPLSAYLLKPIQRITKYQLLLKQILKCSGNNSAEIQAAFDAMLAVLKSVNDSMHKTAIVGYPRDLNKLGPLLLQAPFSVHMDHKKAKVKSLARNRFNKTSQRHLFLFEKELLLCKLQNVENNPSDNNSAHGGHIVSPSNGSKRQCYAFKNSIQMSAVEILEKTRTDARKLELFHQGKEVYTLLAVSASVKQEWLEEIRKIVAKYPRKSTNSLDLKNTEKKKAGKARRQKQKKSRSDVITLLEHYKQPNKQEEFQQRKVTTLKRSSSLEREKPLEEQLIDISSKVRNSSLSDVKNSNRHNLVTRRSMSLPYLDNLSLGSSVNEPLIIWSYD